MIEPLPGEVIAEALRIAERRLERLGWKYNGADVGQFAREILVELQRTKS